MTLNHSIKIALVAIVGGIGTLIGPIIGSFIVMGLDEGLRVLFGGEAKGIDFMVFGIIVTLIAIFEPRGISKLISRITRVISQKYFK
jgi:branched-chain amino acid transport system permease protein